MARFTRQAEGGSLSRFQYKQKAPASNIEDGAGGKPFSGPASAPWLGHAVLVGAGGAAAPGSLRSGEKKRFFFSGAPCLTPGRSRISFGATRLFLIKTTGEDSGILARTPC